VILFPLAHVWLVVALVWILRNSTNEPDVPQRDWRRFVPRVPRRPWSGGPTRRGAAETERRQSRPAGRR
jgi:hypothetical protein